MKTLKSIRHLGLGRSEKWKTSASIGLQMALLYFPEMVLSTLYELFHSICDIVVTIFKLATWIPMFIFLGLIGHLHFKDGNFDKESVES